MAAGSMLEVVVVGAGMAGVSTALALASRGVAVNLVDSGRPANAATGASAGMIAPQYESPGPGPLYRAGIVSRAAWPTFARRLGEMAGAELPLEVSGMLVANFDEAEERDARTSVDWQRAAGQSAEILSPAEAGELQEGLGPEARSWLWLPDEGQVDAQRLVDLFDAALRRTDIRLLTGTPVREIALRGGAAEGVVLEDGRRVSADRVVVAAGAWSAGLAAAPVRPIRGQMLRMSPGPLPLRRIAANHGGRYLVPRSDHTVLAGSTMEDAGFDRSITESGANDIRAACARLVPAVMESNALEQWADLRPISIDGVPILGPDPQIAGLFHATGAGRSGILLGPLIGEIISGAILDGDPTAARHGLSPGDLASFAPSRFGAL